MSEQAQSLYVQGLKKHRAKEYPAAVDLLEQATQADPEHADAWEALGVLYDKIERVDDAIAATERLLELKPDEIMGHTNLSRFYMKKGLTEKAEEEQSKARILGWRAELAGKGPDAENAFAQANQGEQPGAPSLVSFVGGVGGTPPAMPTSPPKPDTAQLEQRIAQFRALADQNPEDVMCRFTLGKTYLQAERPNDAVEILEELLKLKEDYTAAMPLLGEAYEKAGKIARAIKLYNKGIEIANAKGDLNPRNQMEARLAAITGGGA